jgi:hypothetical protein
MATVLLPPVAEEVLYTTKHCIILHKKTQDKMAFTTEDIILIKNLYLFKGYNVTRSLAEVQNKNWEKAGMKKLLRFIVHCKNCRQSSKKHYAICAIYYFTRYCSTRSWLLWHIITTLL